MDFETSLVTYPVVKEEIIKLSKVTGKSTCFIAKRLIELVIKEMDSDDCLDSLTEYQQSYKDEDLIILRYRLSKIEHDDFTFARHKFKISISKMLLIGFLLFFDKLVEKYCENKKKVKIIINNYTAIFAIYYFLIKESLEKRGIRYKNST